MQISAVTTTNIYVEYTTNLSQPFKPYPSPRFQLIFSSNSGPEMIPFPLAGQMYFRGR